MRPLDMSKPHKMLLPTSGIGYWQVEIAEWPLSGDVVVWETPLRLRHLATQMYLCFKPDESVSGGYKAVLTCDGGNDSAVFCMVPDVRHSDTIPVDSYGRLQHVATGIRSLIFCRRSAHKSWHCVRYVAALS